MKNGSVDIISALLFSVLITDALTDAIKDAIGQPIPYFFWSCFHDGVDVSLLHLAGITEEGVTFKVLSRGVDIEQGYFFGAWTSTTENKDAINVVIVGTLAAHKEEFLDLIF
ncbi:Phosphatidic acid phosphatase/chloroperoxidase, N-terminal [Artemisia annua]|uniref:Phosphatidic acid phosphatase/chloroperoxidase, N-terminal n=1 Tax=Artemisia annua TaxID=35608 RepID=A0A2U1NS27_ARTAN|nr:Phosphatidic acid phosphatase/chloroperoxidase, N-terminal [Artemisia annua]